MKTLKEIIIIGSGIAGLRAALEIAKDKNTKVTILEKSPSVGGRIATRRFGDLYVNHGAEKFDGLSKVMKIDPEAKALIKPDILQGRATDFPKHLRDLLSQYGTRVEFKFNWEVAKVFDDSSLVSKDDEKLYFDHLIITAPVPQAEKITGKLVPDVQYYKTIIFIGAQSGEVKRIEMDFDWSERMFEKTDSEILDQAQIKDLTVKKWRYAQVKQGIDAPFLPIGEKVLIAGDAFDPEKEFNLGSSWLSGLSAGKEALWRIYE